MANLNELKPIINLNPFAKFCCTIGNLPSSYMASLTYEEQLMWLCDYLQNTIIPTVNNNAECVKELQELYVKLKNYVDNYFENLDVQNEINNKLDQMSEDGTLTLLLAPFMPFIFPEMYGAKGNGVEDDTNAFITAINTASSTKKKLYLNNKTYKVNAFSITLSNDLNIEGNNAIIENSGELVLLGNNNNIEIKNITIQNGNASSLQEFNNVNLENYNAINQNKFGVLISNSNFVNIINSKFIENGKNLTFNEISNKGMAIFASSCSNVNVNSCYFEKNWGQSALRLNACNEININNNKFINNMFRAIELPTVDGNLYNYNGKISNNYINGCGYNNINPENDERTNGIFGNGADGNVDIIDNIIINSQENGIEGRFRHIKGNIIDGTGVGTKPTTACVGASVVFKTFENNIVKNTLSNGLSGGGTGSERSNSSIINNSFENIGGQAGILFGFIKGGSSIENLSIFNNVCNNKPIICWSGNIDKLTLSNLITRNNHGINLVDNQILSVIPKIGYNNIDVKELLTLNNRFLNWSEENKPLNWHITENATLISKIIDENDIICNINGISYNTYIEQEFELPNNLNNSLYELIVTFKAPNIQYYLYNVGNDGSNSLIYTNSYNSPNQNNFETYKLNFNPYANVTTGKLIFKIRTSGDNMQFKEISLNRYFH